MAEYLLPELQMMGEFYGDRDLIHNELFWMKCLLMYRDRRIRLPLQDNSSSRRRLKDMLVCPPGTCGLCCRHYEHIPVSPYDIERLSNFHPKLEKYLEGQSLSCANGCQFLKENACSIYSNRPDACAEYPIDSNPTEVILSDGRKLFEINYRLLCEPSLTVIRKIMEEATSTGKLFLLPDLSLAPIPDIKMPKMEVLKPCQ
jgi:Fe-S-cluster containining protein